MKNWPFHPITPLSVDFAMIDPPWDFRFHSRKGETRKAAGGQYDLMTFEEIAALPVADLFRGDGVLWCWATHPLIHKQIAVVEGWGFRFATTGVWVKRTRNGKLAFGTGYRLRCASEPFIIATLGKPKTAKNIRTVIEGPLREHSRKPDEAYEVAERMMPGAMNRADIFSREKRQNWENWGNEKNKFGGAA